MQVLSTDLGIKSELSKTTSPTICIKGLNQQLSTGEGLFKNVITFFCESKSWRPERAKSFDIKHKYRLWKLVILPAYKIDNFHQGFNGQLST